MFHLSDLINFRIIFISRDFDEELLIFEIFFVFFKFPIFSFSLSVHEILNSLARRMSKISVFRLQTWKFISLKKKKIDFHSF